MLLALVMPMRPIGDFPTYLLGLIWAMVLLKATKEGNDVKAPFKRTATRCAFFLCPLFRPLAAPKSSASGLRVGALLRNHSADVATSKTQTAEA
ncbi:MAG TPA: hypothetical protein VL361_27020 [Candidatus Limnocylindrales bacterium]|nr:hypothetical protein [Candidatus Limnocylindrales bacterium]